MSTPLSSLASSAFLRGAAFALVAALGAPLTGCAATNSGAVVRVEGSVTPVDVQDKDFAGSVERVLRDGKPSTERLALLLGVVRRQLAHADTRFRQAHDDAGTRGVIGALYLVRVGEARPEMIDATGSRALASAVDRLAPRGDEGRTLALLHLRQPGLAPGSPDRARLDEHMSALTTWMHETRTGPPLKRIGDEERAALGRALLEPNDGAVSDAVATIQRWIQRAEQTRSAAMRGEMVMEDSSEIVEDRQRMLHLRAEETGPVILAALYLRHGDVASAADSVERAASGPRARPILQRLLREAAKSDSAAEWIALSDYFVRSNEEDLAFPLDDDTQEAALWGTSLEAYRREPTSIEASMHLAHALLYFGIPEAAPAVLTDAVRSKPAAANVGASMELLADGLAQAAYTEGPDAARRVFQAGGALLGLADKARVEPSSARVRGLMASIEVRAGNLAVAQPLLVEATRAEPTTSSLTMLAQVERQLGNAKAASDAVAAALRAPDARAQLLDVAEADMFAFELHRDANEQAEAKQALDAALTAALSARQQRATPASRARAERLLGRILEQYGETKGAARAFERALAVAATDRPTLGAAMLDAIGRALVRRDLLAARTTLKRGLEGNVGEEDLVYGALWVQLLEREQKAPPDGTVERALHAGAHSSWTNKLTLWASGKITDSDLTTAAQSPTQKVEAAFYTAMARKVAGDPGAVASLRAVASAPVLDLLEVQLAREIVAPEVRSSLPGGVQAP